MTSGRLARKNALVTAAGSGIGRASALLFASEGAHVVVVDINEAAAVSTVDEIDAAGGSAEAHCVDVGDLPALERVARRVEEAGPLHVLFNHAGIPGPVGLDFTPEDWARVIDVNMRGGVFLTNYLLGALRAAGGASVIFTSSTAGLVGSEFSPIYSLSKSGLVGYVRALALALAADGIRANAICPGHTDTPMLRRFSAGGSDTELATRRDALYATIPAGRLGRPQELAAAALFLASDESAYVTGIALPVDGGFTAR